MRRSIKDYSITELSDLQYTLENLPLEIDNTLNINGEKVDIEEYFEKMQDDFFNVPDEEYRNAIGKIFLNKKDGVAFKVGRIQSSLSYKISFTKNIISSTVNGSPAIDIIG